jgi:hypothetical protein
MDLQVGGSSKLNILKSGNIQFGSGGILSSGGYYLSDSSGNGGSFDGTGISLKSNGIMQWANSSNASGTKDVILARDAANTLALRNSTNAQTFNVYETYTDGSNYSRVTARFAGGDFEMLVNAAGTGGSNGKLVLGTRIANKGIDFYTANLQRWNIDGASGSFLAGTDNTYDIGASGATRPRTGYFGTSVVTPLLTSTGAVQAYSGTAIPAGGTTGSGFKVSSTSNFGVFFGSGAPSLSAAKGSLYLRSDGSGTTDRAYINTDGSTTWTALTTAA